MFPIELISIITALSLMFLIIGIDLQIKKNKRKSALQIRMEKIKKYGSRTDDQEYDKLTVLEQSKEDSLFHNVAVSVQATISNINGGVGILEKLDEKLSLAGNPRGWEAKEFIAFYVLFAGGFLIIGGLLVQVNYLPAFFYILSLVAGFAYPYGWLKSRIAERQVAVFSELPNFIDQILLNLSEEKSILDKAIREVVLDKNDILEKDRENILIKEFRQAYLLQASQKLESNEAYSQAATRIDLPEVYDLVDVFNQWYTDGTPITHILEEMGEHVYNVFEQKMTALIKKKDLYFTAAIMLIAISTFIIIVAPIIVTAGGALGGLS